MAVKQELNTSFPAEELNGPTASNGRGEYQDRLVLVPETIFQKGLNNFVRQTALEARGLIREATFSAVDNRGLEVERRFNLEPISKPKLVTHDNMI